MNNYDKRLSWHASSERIDVSERSRYDSRRDFVEFFSKVKVLVFLHYND